MLKADHVAAGTQRGVAWLFWMFGILLLSNVVLSWFMGSDPGDGVRSRESVRTAATALTVAELFDTIVVCIAFVACSRMIPAGSNKHARPKLIWILALPVLAALLVLNVGYHRALLTLSGARPETDTLFEAGHYRWWFLTLICVQPALIEELFFRRLVFDFFHSHTTLGTAAFSSAAMFAAAHTGGLLSFPYLVVFGTVMAILRWYSGSLAVPIVIHALHNFLISYHELAAS